MQNYLQQQPAWAASLLPLVEGLLEHVAKCLAMPSMAVAMVAGRLCLALAEFTVAVLRARLALTEEHAQVRLVLVVGIDFPGRQAGTLRSCQGPKLG